jgi:TonB family protein
LYFTAGKLGKASAEFARVIEGRRKGPKDQRPEAGKAILYLAQIHQAEGRSEKAHAHYMSALQIFTEHPDRYAKERDMAFGMAAGMLDQRIRYTKVRRDSASLRQTMLFLDRAADLHATYGEGKLGEELARQSIEVRRQTMGAKSPAVWRGLIYLSRALTSQKRYDDANAALEQALELLRADGGIGPLAETPILKEQAKVAAASGSSTALEKAHWRLIEVRREAFGPQAAQLHDRFDEAVAALRELGDEAAAGRFLQAKTESVKGPWDGVGSENTEVTLPKQVKSAPPGYPSMAKTLVYEASVEIEALVDENGDVTHAHVSEAAGHGLDRAAVTAVQKWKFEPGRIRGQAVPTLTRFQVNFVLRTGL